MFPPLVVSVLGAAGVWNIADDSHMTLPPVLVSMSVLISDVLVMHNVFTKLFSKTQSGIVKALLCSLLGHHRCDMKQ